MLAARCRSLQITSIVVLTMQTPSLISSHRAIDSITTSTSIIENKIVVSSGFVRGWIPDCKIVEGEQYI